MGIQTEGFVYRDTVYMCRRDARGALREVNISYKYFLP